MSANASILHPTQVYTNKSHLLDEAHEGGSDNEDGRGPKMVYFDLQVDIIWLCWLFELCYLPPTVVTHQYCPLCTTMGLKKSHELELNRRSNSDRRGTEQTGELNVNNAILHVEKGLTLPQLLFVSLG